MKNRKIIYNCFQPEDPSSDCLNLTEDVKYEDTPGAICGLEISFSSVPQDVDIKLISADEPVEWSSQIQEQKYNLVILQTKWTKVT